MAQGHTHYTFAATFIGGTLAGSFAGWFLVPAALPVDYLTPIVLFSTFAGCVGGAVLVRLRKDAPDAL